MSKIDFIASEFNSEQVIQKLKVGPHESGIRMAIHYIYREVKEDLNLSQGTLAERAKQIAETTESFIFVRLGLLREYRDNFFLGSPHQEDALAIAVLCNEFTPHINECIQSEDGDIKKITTEFQSNYRMKHNLSGRMQII